MQRERTFLIAVALVALSTLISPLQRDLFVGDETKYGQVVREMRSTGAFFLPTLNGQPFTHKPPVHFWMIDLLTIPLGLYSMWAFVIPSLVAFALLLWLMWRVGGPLAAFICGTSLMIWGSAQTARMDVSFTALIVIGVWQMRRFFDADDDRALVFCGVALGVAALIKGPMAPVIGLVLFVLESVRRRRRPRRRDALALLVMMVIPLLWLVPAMMAGGSAFTREVVMKQTVGRAVASWVHKAPPWFYLEHMPATLFPWFFLAVVAVFALWRTERFLINWILAVIVPYSLMSSKLDVYMMAMIPPVALLIAQLVRSGALPRWSKAANLATLGLIFIGGIVAGVRMPREFESVPHVGALLAFTIISAFVAFIIALRARVVTSTLLVGVVPIAVMVFLSARLMPFANAFGSTRALVDVLQRQPVAPEEISLYATPYLWTRDFPRRLERVVYADPETLRHSSPRVVVTSRAHANEIAFALAGFRKVDEVKLIGKWFDVYRR